MLIDREAIRAYLERDFNSYLWMKKLAAERILRELADMKPRPRFKTEPWLHQLVCFYIGIVEPRFLFLLDMGLGKSKILADLLGYRIRTKAVERGIITVPRLINIDSWMDDLARHSWLEPNPVTSTEIDGKREALLNPRGEVTVVDYHGLRLALSKKDGRKLVRDEKRVRQFQKLYGFVGIDEIHKLSNHSTLQDSIMTKLTGRADFVYGSTGTLFGHDPQALWNQFYLVDRGETFGENLGIFRASLFTAKTTPFKVKYVFNKRMEHDLHRMLQNKSIRYEEGEVHELPKRVMLKRVIDLTAEQRGHYVNALEGIIHAGGKLMELDAQWLRMRQIASGYLAWKDDYGRHHKAFAVNPKMEALVSVADEINGSKLVVSYEYTETGRLIVERLKKEGYDVEWLYGGSKDPAACRRRFIEDPKCRVLVMNSEAGGTGNDGLQKVARHLVFYETPTSPTTRQQVLKRIHRPGQEHRCFIIDLIADKSLDGGILADIAEGLDCHERVVNGKLPPRKFFLTAAHER